MDTKDLIAFLGSLPTTADTIQWKEQLGEGLKRLFPDVDHVVVAIKLTIDMSEAPVAPERRQVIYSHREPATARQRYLLESATARAESEQWRAIYEQGINSGIPLQQYGDPVGVDIVGEGGAYHGSLLLFRRAGLAPISDVTRDTLHHLRPFLGYVYTDHIARRRAAFPADGAFHQTLERLATQKGLTRREEQALLCLMTGQSYDDAARTLHISPKSFENYVSRVYAKLCVRSVKEIFARYLGVEHHAAPEAI